MNEYLPPANDPPNPPRPRRQTRLPMYRVLLLRSPSCELMHVVRTVMEILRYCRAEATHKMWQAHQDGRAPLLITHKERAELFVELFADRKVQLDIEPA